MKVIKYLLIAIAAVVAGVAILVGGVVGVWFWWYKSSELHAVGTTATFEESADCLARYGNSPLFGDWRLDKFYVAQCFPTQTAAKQKALIACFNKYERNHADHEGWPEENMRGCKWDRAADVGSLAFGKVVAVPAVPRAGKPFVLRVGVALIDSVGEIVDAGIGETFFHTEQAVDDVAVTIGGEKVVTTTLIDGENFVTTSPTDFDYGFFPNGKMFVRFTVPKTAAGKHMTIKIKMTIADETPAATKVATFTVGP